MFCPVSSDGHSPLFAKQFCQTSIKTHDHLCFLRKVNNGTTRPFNMNQLNPLKFRMKQLFNIQESEGGGGWSVGRVTEFGPPIKISGSTLF